MSRHIRLSVPLKRRPIGPVLLGDAGLEGVVRVRLDQQLAHGLEHGPDAAGRLPGVGLQDPQAHVPAAVVGHVGVPDARREVDRRRLERVLRRQR